MHREKLPSERSQRFQWLQSGLVASGGHSDKTKASIKSISDEHVKKKKKPDSKNCDGMWCLVRGSQSRIVKDRDFRPRAMVGQEAMSGSGTDDRTVFNTCPPSTSCDILEAVVGPSLSDGNETLCRCKSSDSRAVIFNRKSVSRSRLDTFLHPVCNHLVVCVCVCVHACVHVPVRVHVCVSVIRS